MNNYLDGLKEKNMIYLVNELASVLSEKCSSIKKNQRAQVLASKRLQRWHDEYNVRCQAQDELIDITKGSKDTAAILNEYKTLVESSYHQH